MALVTRFEELHAWQEARRLATQSYGIARCTNFRCDRSLADQLRRAAVSAMNNIAEGFDSGSNAEFQRFLRYAVRSTAEVQSCLYLARDQRYIDDEQFALLYETARRVKSLCSALIQRLGSRPPRRGVDGGVVRDAEVEWCAVPGRMTSAPPHLRTSAL